MLTAPAIGQALTRCEGNSVTLGGSQSIRVHPHTICVIRGTAVLLD